MVSEPSGFETLPLCIHCRVNERLRIIDILSEVDGYVNFSQRNLAMSEVLTYYAFRPLAFATTKSLRLPLEFKTLLMRL